MDIARHSMVLCRCGYLRLRFEDLSPMDLDPVFLARIQFAFTIAFHIIFPSFTIGLSAYIATLGALWLRTDNERYHRLMRFWTKIFAVSFAMGVVSGIV